MQQKKQFLLDIHSMWISNPDLKINTEAMLFLIFDLKTSVTSFPWVLMIK